MINSPLHKTCCFTGHRELDAGFDREKLKRIIEKAAEIGFDTFLCGMARGFDSECFDVVAKLKREKRLTLIACVPCVNQARYYSQREKEEYEKRLKESDGVIYITDSDYTPGCMQKRNRFMVDNSGLVICYLNKNKGGTKTTVDYAAAKSREIVNIYKK
jgi:hypothetical protein